MATTRRRQVIDERSTAFACALLAIEAVRGFGEQSTPTEIKAGARKLSPDYMSGFNSALDCAVAAIQLVRGPLPTKVRP